MLIHNSWRTIDKINIYKTLPIKAGDTEKLATSIFNNYLNKLWGVPTYLYILVNSYGTIWKQQTSSPPIWDVNGL